MPVRDNTPLTYAEEIPPVVTGPALPNTRSPQEVYQRALQQAWQQYQPLPTPTFSPSYFTPTALINRLNQVFQAQPQINTQQLQQQARTQAGLLTNPQIEALRQQIRALQSLIPQAQHTINTAYSQANQQLGQLGQQVIGQMLEQLSREPGGIRTGVPYELSRRVQEAIAPLSDALEVARQTQLDQIIGALEVEKQNAQNMLNTLERNRPNLEEMQFNTLYDQALERFRAAQNLQLQYLSQLIGMEMDARSAAAQAQQASVEQYNQYLRNLLTLQLEEAERARIRQLESNIQAWQNFIFAPDVRTPLDALRRMENNRDRIIRDIGVDAYQRLYNQISSMGLNTILPSYQGPLDTTPPATTSTQPATSTSNLFTNLLRRLFVTSPLGTPFILGGLFTRR